MSVQLSGIIPPVITSFDSNGEFDEKAQREVINFLTPKVNGFYPNGTYGSGPLMTIEERKRSAEVIIDEVNGRVPVMVHVGAINTQQTVELAKHAEQIGADAVGTIPPYYYKYPEEDLLNHFRAVLEAVDIPVFVYNNPELSNNPISENLLKKLAGEGLAGVKDSSFDLITFYNFLIGINPSNFTHIIGTEAISAAAVHAGAKGVISGLANVWPELMAELWQALQSDKGSKAGEVQLRVLKARSILKYAPTLVSCYAVLKMRGINAGLPRKPYLPLSKEMEQKVHSEFKKMGLF